MPVLQTIDPHLTTAHTTAAASSVAHWVAQHHGLAVDQCYLIRRGLNDNYLVRLKDGTRLVARLYSIRPRGGFNVAFETALLVHLKANGADVAAPCLTTDGRAYVDLQFPEGPRVLALSGFVEGAVPDTHEDHELTGQGLARIHEAARSYSGPPSRYTLDGCHLAGRTLEHLKKLPAADKALLATYRGLVGRLLKKLETVEARLTRVICHGDTHGFNNHIDRTGDTARAVFFDFDDAGPGFLAYDLCVLPWSYLFRKDLKAPDDLLRERWTRYVAAYRAAGGEVTDDDLAAVPLFMQLRQLWNCGEALGRTHHWGTSWPSAQWLRKQPELLRSWGKVEMRV